jgi:hypothetical protein
MHDAPTASRDVIDNNIGPPREWRTPNTSVPPARAKDRRTVGGLRACTDVLLLDVSIPLEPIAALGVAAASRRSNTLAPHRFRQQQAARIAGQQDGVVRRLRDGRAPSRARQGGRTARRERLR